MKITLRKRSLSFPIFCLSLCSLLSTDIEVFAAESNDDSAYERITEMDSLTLSQDGDRLYAFQKKWGQERTVIRTDLKSGQTQTIFSPRDGKVQGLRLGPKEKRLVFVSDAVGDERHKLHIVDIESGRYLVPTPRGHLDLPCDFSPSGDYVYAARGNHIWGGKSIVRISSLTGEAETIVDIKKASLVCSDVSGDGKQLLIQRYMTNDEWHLGLVDLETGDINWLVREPNVSAQVGMFSGNAVYFLSNRETGKIRLWKYEPGVGIEPVELPVKADLQSFSLNSKGYMAIAHRGALHTRNQLFRLDESGNWRPVATGADAAHVRAIGVARNTGKRFIVFIEDGKPPVLNVLENGKLRVLVEVDESGLPNKAFARFQSHLIESFDGTKIPTHILFPSSATKKTPLPMVVFVHGGPQDHIDPNYSPSYQRLANAGFVVVLPNVRGSSGFGEKFMHMDNGDWGGAHIRDLLAVANYAAKLDFISDRPRFIMGDSFGGFSVLSTITQYPKAFDGAIDKFGIADIQSFIKGLSDQAKPYFLGELGFDPEKEPGRARAISPLHHADRIAIPLQIHQGVHDPRVLPEQSRAMVEVLKRGGVKVEYFEYDEGHGFTKQNNDLLARERMRNFLKHLRDSYKAK